MNGQWIGTYSGTNTGELMLNIDDRGSHFQGVAYLKNSNNSLPTLGALVWSRDKDTPFEFRVEKIWAIHPQTGHVATEDDVKKLYPGITIPAAADLTGQ